MKFGHSGEGVEQFPEQLGRDLGTIPRTEPSSTSPVQDECLQAQNLSNLLPVWREY